jgi:hypothetical protein
LATQNGQRWGGISICMPSSLKIYRSWLTWSAPIKQRSWRQPSRPTATRLKLQNKPSSYILIGPYPAGFMGTRFLGMLVTINFRQRTPSLRTPMPWTRSLLAMTSSLLSSAGSIAWSIAGLTAGSLAWPTTGSITHFFSSSSSSCMLSLVAVRTASCFIRGVRRYLCLTQRPQLCLSGLLEVCVPSI